MSALRNLVGRLFAPFGEEYKDITGGVVLGLLSVAWVFLVGTTIERIQAYDAMTVVRFLTLIGASVGVFIAIWKIFHDQRWRRSETYLEQSTGLIEKSFTTLAVDESTGYPVNNRYLWLSSTRLLLAGIALGAKITDECHKGTFAEIIEYWRIQFRERIEPNGNGPDDKHYYYEDGALLAYSTRARAPLAEQSIAVLYRFIEWPEGRGDRLTRENRFSETEIHSLRFHARGLYEYCQDIRNRSKHI